MDLSPDLEAKLQALAAQRGTGADEAAPQVLAEGLQAVPVPQPREETELEREERRRRQREAARAGFGKMAGLGVTVDGLLAQRREEARREMEAA